MNYLQKWWQTLISIFFVQSCPKCGAETERGVFCRNCRGSALMLTPMQVHFLDNAVMGYKYDGALKDMLHKLKFAGEHKFLQPLAEEAEFLAAAYTKTGFDYVVSIPTDAERRKKRGFDIPESIFAKALADKGMWHPGVLARVKKTAPQYGLTPDKRRSNVQGCFKVMENVKGKSILLVDDILTTGATLDEAAKILKTAGAENVCALTLCGSLENFRE